MSLPDDNEEIQPQDPRKEQEEVDQDTERALFLKAFAEDTTKSYKYYATRYSATWQKTETNSLTSNLTRKSICLFLNDMQILTKEIPVSLELHKENIDPVELDNATFDKVSEVFRNIYPGIYEGIEKFWFSSREYWDKVGLRI